MRMSRVIKAFMAHCSELINLSRRGAGVLKRSTLCSSPSRHFCVNQNQGERQLRDGTRDSDGEPSDEGFTPATTAEEMLL